MLIVNAELVGGKQVGLHAEVYASIVYEEDNEFAAAVGLENDIGVGLSLVALNIPCDRSLPVTSELQCHYTGVGRD